MTGSSFGRIAQLLYKNEQPFDFTQLATDLHRSLSRLDDTGLPLGWEGDGLAYIDLSAVRIVLGIAHHPGSGHSACLTVAVEPSADGSHAAASAGFEETCVSLVDYLHRSYPAVTILWHQVHEPLTSALHDRLVAALPLLAHRPIGPAQDDILGTDAEYRRTRHSEGFGPLARPSSEPESAASFGPEAKCAKRITPKTMARSASARARARAVTARSRGRTHFTAPARGDALIPLIAADGSPHPGKFNFEFARVRGAFNQMEPEPPVRHLRAPMRITTHVLNASLILVWPPLGAAVMAHSVIRRESTRFSGYIVVLTGLFGVAPDSTVGQYLATIAGV
ncbi:MAG: hypothetical protein Q7J44_19270 [Pseudotabrizicola sp.]|uniref:hypothetical protein n=1 Tax=Pseudotabrizicola sp. TaxID=2939647 RepID=UPI002725EE73|nr:hypothetical protein [Pseudotabrizicola sp.]MDO9640681.1 hypothetical protein [Pseudotabrizicola sp.]